MVAFLNIQFFFQGGLGIKDEMVNTTWTDQVVLD